MSQSAVTAWVVGETVYKSRAAHELEVLLGATFIAEWAEPGRRGTVALHTSGLCVCSCRLNLCPHIAHAKNVIADKVWSADHPQGAA